MPDSVLENDKITLEEVTFKKFPSLLGKRIGFLFLKLAGSRTMLFTFLIYFNAIVLMWLFATKELSESVMKNLIILFISVTIFVSLILGFIKFEPIKAEFKIQK